MFAPAGMLLGHAVGYLLVASHEHDAAIAAAHAHMPAVALLAAPAAIAALVLSAVYYRAPVGGGRLLALSGAQVAAYGGMEALERVASGLSAAAAVHDPAVLAGLAAQLAVAVVLMGVERGARQVGRLVAEALRARRPRLASHTPPPLGPAAIHVPVGRATNWRVRPRRGPPVRLLAR